MNINKDVHVTVYVSALTNTQIQWDKNHYFSSGGQGLGKGTRGSFGIGL